MTELEYIRYTYGDEAHNIAKSFKDNGSILIQDYAKHVTYSMTTEVSLWTYLHMRYSMMPLKEFMAIH